MITNPKTLPAPVREALDRGELLEAMKLMRGSGLGMKDAKDAMEAYMSGKPAPHAPTFSAPAMGQVLPPTLVDASLDGLSPGQVRDSGSAMWWVGLTVLGVLGYMVLRDLIRGVSC